MDNSDNSVSCRHVPANAVIAVDVGNNTYSFGRYFDFGIRVTQKENLDKAIQEAMAFPGLAIVEVITDVALI